MSNLERLVSKRVRKPKTPSTPSPTLSAPDTSSSNPFFEDISKVLPFLEQDSPFTPIYFQEPKLEEHSFESVPFTFTQAQKTPVAGPSAIVHQPTPISILPPPPFIFAVC